VFSIAAIHPARSRSIHRPARPKCPFVLCAAVLLCAVALGGSAATGDASVVRAPAPVDVDVASGTPPDLSAGARRTTPGAVVPTDTVTPTEALAVMRAIAPLRETYPGCGQTVEMSDTAAAFTCAAAAGHFFRIAVEAFRDEGEALARFETLREDHPIVPFHGYQSAVWEYDEQPSAMRHRQMFWQARRWVFTATAFDDTVFNIAADPSEMAERMHEAAQAVGLVASAAPAGGWDVEHLDDRAGAVSAVIVDGERAYVGVGQTLEVVDVADPARPRALGSRTLNGQALDIVVDNAVAYLAKGDAGFETIDVSDPTQPLPRDGGSVPSRGVALSGDFVVLAGGTGAETGLRVFDKTAPGYYEPLSFVPTPGDALAVATVPGRTAFVADGDGGLRLIDIGVPQQAKEVSWLPMKALDVAVPASGPYVYVAAGDGGLVIVDAADPTAPSIVGTFSGGGGPTFAVEVAGDIVYASIEYGDVVAVDVSTPAAPFSQGAYAPVREIRGCDGLTRSYAERASHLAIAGGRAYAASWENGLRVLDVTAPGAPVEIGAYASPFACAMDVRIAGDHAYVAADRDGLHVLGWRSSDHLREVGAVDGITATMLAVGDGYVVAADNHALWIVDVRDPSAPAVAGSMQPFGRWILDLDVKDGFVYVATAGMEGRLMIVDARDPAAPHLVGEYPTDHPLWRVAVSGHHAYVLDGSSLFVIDVAQVASPIRVWRLALPGMASEIELAGDKLYTANADGMLHVVDIADPTKPRLVGAHRAPALATLAVSDATAILSGDAETSVLSLAHPTDPVSRLHFSVTTSARASGIAVDGEDVLFARGARGLLMQWIGPFSRPSEVERRPEFVGQVGGGYEATALDGTVAYVGIGPRLTAIDMSDPARPSRLGETGAFPDVVQDVALRGRTAIVADGRGGLRIVDVTSSTAPREVGALAWPAAAREVVVAGDVAYVADVSAGLAIVDVSEPTDPRLLATIGDAGARSVAVGGGHAYVLADRLSEVQVYDVRVPITPKRVGTEMFLGGGSRLVLADHFVFVAALDSGLLVIDVTDPAAPRRTGWLECRALDVAVRDDRAYVLGEEWLTVVDVAIPSEPILLGTWRTPGDGATVALDAAGRAVVADRAAGLRVVDVSDASAPRELGGYRQVGVAHNVFAAGPLAYVAAREGGLDIVSVAWPSDPAAFAHVDVMATDVVVQGTFAYVAGEGKLHVIGVSDPFAPRSLGRLDLPGEPSDIVLGSGFAFVTTGRAGLAIVDVSDPNALRVAGTVDTPGDARAVALRGAYAYVADGAAGLRVIDWSDPAAPREVGAIAGLVGASGVSVLGDHAYISRQVPDPEVSGVWALDVSDPATPCAVGSLGTWGAPAGLIANGNTVFVATGRMGVSAVNASDPTEMGEFERYEVPGLPRGVAVLERYLLVAADEGGLYILERGVPRSIVSSTLYFPAAAR
jgi:hypothetical protein